MMDLYTRCPELAVRETRTVTVPPGGVVPPGQYGFLENYCVNPSCDCRRVLIRVCPAESPDVTLATINYGWETEEFYRKWFGIFPDEEGEAMARDVTGAGLDLINPQSPFADYFLDLFREMVRSDADYVQRFSRHYEAFRKRAPAGRRNRGTNRPPGNRQRPKKRRG